MPKLKTSNQEDDVEHLKPEKTTKKKTDKENKPNSNEQSKNDNSGNDKKVDQIDNPDEIDKSLSDIKKEIHKKSTLDKKDILKVKLVIESVSDKLKEVCKKLKDKNLENIDVEYSEKDKQCIVKSTLNLAHIAKSIESKNMKDEETELLRNDFINEMGPNNSRILYFVRSNNFDNLTPYNQYQNTSPMEMSPSSIDNLYPGMYYQNGGQYLGNVNGCPNNSRLVYDSQGIIGCNNPINQGGQAFLYPKKITACVAGGAKSKKGKLSKKNIKNNKKSKGGSKYCQVPPPTGSCPNPDQAYNGLMFCSPPQGLDGPGCSDYQAIPQPPVSYPFGFPPNMNNRLPGGVVKN